MGCMMTIGSGIPSGNLPRFGFKFSAVVLPAIWSWFLTRLLFPFSLPEAGWEGQNGSLSFPSFSTLLTIRLIVIVVLQIAVRGWGKVRT